MNNKNINNLIDECIDLVMKSRVRYDDSLRLREMLYLSCIAFRIHYGDKIINRLFEIYRNLNIYCSSDNLFDMLDGYNNFISNDTLRELDSNSNALSVYGSDLSSYLFISFYNINNLLEFLDVFIHELNHIFVGSRSIVKDGCLINMVGFSIDSCNEYGSVFRYGEGFNEAINSLTSEDMVRRLIRLSRVKINNDMIKNIFNKLRCYRGYNTNSYFPFVDRLREFYYNRDIYEIIKIALICNDYTILENYLNDDYRFLLDYNEFVQSFDNVSLNEKEKSIMVKSRSNISGV